MQRSRSFGGKGKTALERIARLEPRRRPADCKADLMSRHVPLLRWNRVRRSVRKALDCGRMDCRERTGGSAGIAGSRRRPRSARRDRPRRRIRTSARAGAAGTAKRIERTRNSVRYRRISRTALHRRLTGRPLRTLRPARGGSTAVRQVSTWTAGAMSMRPTWRAASADESGVR